LAKKLLEGGGHRIGGGRGRGGSNSGGIDTLRWRDTDRRQGGREALLGVLYVGKSSHAWGVEGGGSTASSPRQRLEKEEEVRSRHNMR
jgi:hypothetical protein